MESGINLDPQFHADNLGTSPIVTGTAARASKKLDLAGATTCENC